MTESNQEHNYENCKTNIYKSKNLLSKETFKMRMYKNRLKFSHYENIGMVPESMLHLNYLISSKKNIPPFYFLSKKRNLSDSEIENGPFSKLIYDSQICQDPIVSKREKHLSEKLASKLQSLNNLQIYNDQS